MDFGANTTWPDLDTNVVRKFSTMSAGSPGGTQHGMGEEPHLTGRLLGIGHCPGPRTILLLTEL